MKIQDFLCKKAVTANLKGTKKEEIIKELVDLLINSEEVEKKDRAKVVELLMARESLGSTAIGQGVGIPHAKCDCVKKLVASFGLSQKGVDFDSLDGEPVYIFFLLIAPSDSAGPHLKALARISRLLKDKYFRESLKACQDEKNILKVITLEDDKKI
ncbi:MAG: PTS sugar transporter subunit IIA [Candidatus Omnitrophota bacterium]